MTQQGYPQQYDPRQQRDMPRLIDRFQHEQQLLDHGPMAELESRSVMYDYLWPVVSWLIMAGNLAAIIQVFVGKYEAAPHALSSGIAVLSFAVLAMVYRFVLCAPQPPIINPAVAAAVLPAPTDRQAT